MPSRNQLIQILGIAAMLITSVSITAYYYSTSYTISGLSNQVSSLNSTITSIEQHEQTQEHTVTTTVTETVTLTSKENISTSVSSTTNQSPLSSLQLDGAVVASGNVAQGNVSAIMFEIQLAPGDLPLDLSVGKLVVSYQSSDKYVANAYQNSTAGVTITPLTGSGSTIQPGCTFEVTVYPSGSEIADTLTANSSFIIQLEPAGGQLLTIARTLPPTITATMNLD